MASHHICMDGTSSAILFEDLATLYAQMTSGEQTHLAPLNFDYADFAAWQREWMQGKVLEEHLAFWRKHLEGLPPFFDLPSDREVETGSTAGELRSAAMPDGFMEQLTKLCHSHKVTQFTVMLWALAIVLERWSGQKSFAIGTVAGNRPMTELDRVVGCFLNMLPLRMDVGSGESALDVLKRTRTTVLDGFSYGQCPFEAVVDATKVERSAHRNPIFNVGLLLQNFSEITFKTDALDGKAIPFARESALLDLRFVVSIQDEKVTLACEYKRELFEAETVDLLLEAYSQTLRTLVVEPQVKVGALTIPDALSTQAEKARARGSRKLVFSATFTAEPIEEPLKFWMGELEMDYKIEFAPYNQVFQNLLDPSSSLRRNKDGFNVLLVRFEDWQQFKGADLANAKESIQRNVDELISATRAAAATNLATYIVCCCPPSRALANDPEWAAFLLEMEERVAEQLGESGSVQVVTSSRIAELYPVAEYEDRYAEAIGHVPYTKDFFAALATVVVRWVWGLSSPGYKVIALDCDNTLWSGICGEDGPRGVKIGTHYAALQEFVRRQREQGMLLCLCSKNNERDVWEVFEQNSGMLLKRDEITAHRINWERKSQSLRSLAQELKLGLDSFVFLDDNPVECAEVEADCPEVLTLQVPEEIEQLAELLKHVWAFDHFRSTEVDRRRGELYKDNQQREELRQGQSLEEFIESLQLEMTIKPLEEETVARVAQLTQRTNQFNFTTVRRQDGQVRELLHAPSMRCLTVDLRDRFGDYGLIGAVIYGFDESALVVDTFLLSCRALGRRVEHTLLERLGDEARERGLERVDLRFSPTAKNAPALEFLESLEGATKIASDGVVTYRLRAAEVAEMRGSSVAAVV
jgi:FkbH-like protein